MTLGNRIKRLRKDFLNMTMDEFGERIGITKSSISTMESGKSNPSDQTIRFICREFGVNEDWLLSGTGEPFPEKSRHDEIADFVNGLAIDDNSFKSRFIAALSKLNEEEWLTIEKVVKEISKETASVPQDPVATAEEEYIKSASEPVPPMAPAASNSTAGDGNGETA
ncbi:MAG: helix-turn-helix transcriptional regulator [Lachnospiraceae bacterium]|nr:helix-turn-helix transcriptional regulator [Lachnospiraceae bacterium]